MEKRGLSVASMILIMLLATSVLIAATVEAAEPPADRKVRKFDFAIPTPGYDPVRHDWCVLISENWKKLGIDVEVRPIDTGVMISQGLRKHDFDAMVLSWGGMPERIEPDYFTYTCLHSSQAGEGQYNMDGYNNPEYDRYAQLQRVTMDPEERRKAVFKAQEIFARDQPETPVVHHNYIHAYNSADFDSVVPMMGEGLNSHWNFVTIRPTGSQKILRYGHPESFRTLNPLKMVGLHELTIFRLLYDHLMDIDPEGKVVPWAAKDVKVVNDRTIDVTLRDGMTFHDGKPLTADDVKFTFDYVRKWKSGPFMGALRSLDTVEKTGPLSVRIRLKEPDASFLGFAMSYIYMLPKHIWENVPEKVGLKTPEDWTDWSKVTIGSGPFKFEYWRMGEESKFVRHDNHFSNPKVDAILRIDYKDMQTLSMALQRKELDVVGWNLSPLQAQQLKSSKHITVVNVANHGFFPIHYNCRKKPFDDVAFRRALAYGVPKKRIAEEFHEGFAVEAHSMIGPMNKYWHNPNVEKFDLDLEKARKTLRDAGYEWDSKGKLYYPKGN
jgi:peptide/nickel transport system substrate-binding protein